MRRLAPLLLVGAFAAIVRADSPEYLRLRVKHHVVGASETSALRSVAKSCVLELQGKVVGTCRAGDTTILLLQRGDGETQEVESKLPPAWLGESEGTVRLLVRCSRIERGGILKTTLLGAAPEIDVLPAEEAYWRALAAKRRVVSATVASRKAAAPRSSPSGPIGRTSAPSRSWTLPASQVTPHYAAFIRGRNPRLPAAQAMQIAQAIVGFSLRYRVDARLVMAMLMVESGFDPNAVSRSGAVGLGQLMPGTAKWMGVQNSFDTTDNLYGTVKLLRTHLDQYRTAAGSDLSLVLAAYNAGSGAVARHGGVPPYRETQAYVRRVTAIYRKLCGT